MAHKQQSNVTEARSVKAFSSMTLRFYQKDHFVTEIGTQGDRRVLWANEKGLAQLEGRDDKRLLHTDLPGSILGIEHQRLVYSPYGHRAIDAIAAMLGFNGHHLESLTGGYLLGNGHRMYSPSLMRFCGEDALSPFAQGGINAYAYCSGDPINNVDRSGRAQSFVTKTPKPRSWLFSSTGGQGHAVIQNSMAKRPPIEQLATKIYEIANLKETKFINTPYKEFEKKITAIQDFNRTHGIIRKNIKSLAVTLFPKEPTSIPANYGQIHGSAAPRPQSSTVAPSTSRQRQRQLDYLGLTASELEQYDNQQPLTISFNGMSTWRQQSSKDVREALGSHYK